MSTMTNLTIEREVVIEAPADVVWHTITEPDEISRWFADRVELDLRPGGDGSFVFHDAANDSTVTAPLVVETVDPPRLFSFRWTYPDGETPGPGNSLLVEFTLVAMGDERTRLRVVETGLDELSWTDDEKAHCADDHNGGWARHLGRLEGLFAGG
jgi:uncharacterized protein YndB with AHSA1/START domain